MFNTNEFLPIGQNGRKSNQTEAWPLVKKLRLIVTEACDRACKGCCNKQYDLDALPVADYFDTEYEEVMVTGGEPLLDREVDNTLGVLRDLALTEAKVILYTAVAKNVPRVWLLIDGLTLTLHEQSDVEPFLELNDFLLYFGMTDRSLRLNVFKGVTVPETADLRLWNVKRDIAWIENCPLPEGEILAKLR